MPEPTSWMLPLSQVTLDHQVLLGGQWSWVVGFVEESNKRVWVYYRDPYTPPDAAKKTILRRTELVSVRFPDRGDQ